VRGVSPVPARLAELFADSNILKVFHFAPFDLRFLEAHWGVRATSIACTKAASKISDPEMPPQEHSLKRLAKRTLGVELDKGSVRTSDWGARVLTDEQLSYAVADVLHLLDVLDYQLERLTAAGRALDFWNVCGYMPTDAHLGVTGVPNPLEY
jgi:ribonuclease D